MTSAPRTEPERRLPWSAIVRATVLVVVVAAGVVVMRWTPLADRLSVDAVVAGLESVRSSRWAPLLLVLLWVVGSPLGLPASVPLLAGGLAFGFVVGSLYNYVGCMLGALLTYQIGRWLGRDLILELTPVRHFERLERIVERHGFWTLVRIRLIPVPFAAVNYGAAIGGVRPAVFVTTTALSSVPAVAIYTYFMAVLAEAAVGGGTGALWKLGLAVLLILALTLLPSGWQARRLRRRNELSTAPRKEGAP